MWQWKIFSRQHDQKPSVINHVTTRFFFSYHMFLDLGRPMDAALISTIDLMTEFDLVIKFVDA
jgi:hypothetical protein